MSIENRGIRISCLEECETVLKRQREISFSPGGRRWVPRLQLAATWHREAVWQAYVTPAGKRA
jgi:hypothetical protein